MNLAIIKGRLGADPELRHNSDGTAVCRFSLVTKEGYKGKSSTQWHRIVAWGRLGEVCSQYLKKGSEALIYGKIVYTSYEKDGRKAYSTDIWIDKLEFCGGRNESDTASPPDLSDFPF